MSASIQVRTARVADVDGIKELIDHYAGKVVLGKDLVTLYEHIQEFWVAELDGDLVGCGALHVLWKDLAEVRTVAVDPLCRGFGIGHAVLTRLLHQARELGVRWLFALTFETSFFGKHGFHAVTDTPVSAPTRVELARSPDEGIAQFLDLARAKPNTLGNTRMLLDLSAT